MPLGAIHVPDRTHASPTLNIDIILLLVQELSSFGVPDRLSSLLAFSTTSKVFRDVCLASIFSDVRWPRRGKRSAGADVPFFPTTLWPYFKTFRLEWPQEWSIMGNLVNHPPALELGANRLISGYIDRLVGALPHMKSLSSFLMNCPFAPPAAIFNALSQCHNLCSLIIDDTPLDICPMPISVLSTTSISLACASQALRVGDGPQNPKYSDVSFYTRPWRKYYWENLVYRRSLEIQVSSYLVTRQASRLVHLEMSMELCDFATMTSVNWPCLQTLILTGHAPPGRTSVLTGHVSIRQAGMEHLLPKMPNLQDLRLLFAKMKTGDFRILPVGFTCFADSSPFPASLRSFALSTACICTSVLRYMRSLRRLAMLAIIDLPRVPIGLSHEDVFEALKDISISGASLGHLRIMLENKLTLKLCVEIAACCPDLEILEVGLCGYQAGEADALGFAWDQVADAFSPMKRLRHLRVGLQFPEYDEYAVTGGTDIWRTSRKRCAFRLAELIPSLSVVGLEYRNRTGSHRFEDAWLEYRVRRLEDKQGLGDASALTIELDEVEPTWYAFPEVWQSVGIPEW